MEEGDCEVMNTEVTLDRALRYLLSGKAEFEIESEKTGKRLYYKLQRKNASPDENGVPYLYWVYASYEPGNLRYLGTVYFNKKVKQFEFSRGQNGVSGWHNQFVDSILYLLNRLYYRKFNTKIKVYHNGNCGHCGVKLQSITTSMTGICNMCIGKVEDFKVIR